MKDNTKQAKTWLRANANAVAERLKLRTQGTRLRIFTPFVIEKTATDGWNVSIGYLGKEKLSLEIWLDRFCKYPERKLWAGFTTYAKRQTLMNITKRVSHNLWPVRTITMADITEDKFFTLTNRLPRSGFAVPILEAYEGERTLFGFYDPTKEYTGSVNHDFCEHAVTFFEDVARVLPHAKAEDSSAEIFPRCENRKWVKSHLARERSSYLAAQCKDRDGYCCQVCKMTFSDVYGEKLGASFAEAHHLKPLGKQGDKVRTDFADLITVCANCHRMLHKMEGNLGDLKKLISIVRSRHP